MTVRARFYAEAFGMKTFIFCLKPEVFGGLDLTCGKRLVQNRDERTYAVLEA